MSGGGKQKKPSDSAEVRSLAMIAAEKWNLSQQVLKPIQDTFIEEARNLNSDTNREYIQGRVNLGQQASVGAGLEQVTAQVARGGLDMGSGRAQGAMLDATIASAEGGAVAATRANEELDTQQVRGLQSAFDSGSGQESSAIAGIGAIAQTSGNETRQESQRKFNRRSANLQTLGTLAGAAGRYGMSKLGAGGAGDFDYNNMSINPGSSGFDGYSDGASGLRMPDRSAWA